MPSSVKASSFLVNSENIHVETFRKFGLECSTDHNISQEAFQVIECLARACLPIIGEHCKDAIRLHEAKLRSSATQVDDCPELETCNENAASSLEVLHSKHKRLIAQKEVDRSVAIACQASSDLLNRAGHTLQKAAPLITVPNILAAHLDELNRIHVPKLLRADGSVALSLSELIDTTPTLDEVAKYSVQCFLQNRMFDYSDGERAIAVLSNAVGDLNAKIQKLGSAPRDSKLGGNLLHILPHICGLKKLSKNVVDICANRENLSAQFAENIARKCTEILLLKDTKLGQFSMKDAVDTEQASHIDALQDRLVDSVQRLCAEINGNEVIEDRIRSCLGEVYNSRELHFSATNFLPMRRNMFRLAQPVSVASNPAAKSSLALFHETLLDLDLETRMERLDIDSHENRSALEYLASLEFAVDGAKIHGTSFISPGNVDEIVSELLTHELLLSVAVSDHSVTR